MDELDYWRSGMTMVQLRNDRRPIVSGRPVEIVLRYFQFEQVSFAPILESVFHCLPPIWPHLCIPYVPSGLSHELQPADLRPIVPEALAHPGRRRHLISETGKRFLSPEPDFLLIGKCRGDVFHGNFPRWTHPAGRTSLPDY